MIDYWARGIAIASLIISAGTLYFRWDSARMKLAVSFGSLKRHQGPDGNVVEDFDPSGFTLLGDPDIPAISVTNRGSSQVRLAEVGFVVRGGLFGWRNRGTYSVKEAKTKNGKSMPFKLEPGTTAVFELYLTELIEHLEHPSIDRFSQVYARTQTGAIRKSKSRALKQLHR